MSPIHTISFNLPEESEELDSTLKASKYFCAIDDFREYLRQLCKHGFWQGENKEISEVEMDTIEKLRDKFHQCLDEQGVSNDY